MKIVIPIKKIILESRTADGCSRVIYESIGDSLKTKTGLAATGLAGIGAGATVSNDFSNAKQHNPLLSFGDYSNDKLQKITDGAKSFGEKLKDTFTKQNEHDGNEPYRPQFISNHESQDPYNNNTVNSVTDKHASNTFDKDVDDKFSFNPLKAFDDRFKSGLDDSL